MTWWQTWQTAIQKLLDLFPKLKSTASMPPLNVPSSGVENEQRLAATNTVWNSRDNNDLYAGYVMKINAAGLTLIQEFEGFKANAYLDPVGIWTVGWGSTKIDGRPVRRGDTVTPEKANSMMQGDLRSFERAVENALKKTPTENEFSAMVSLAYNIGGGAFAASSVVRKFNAGDIESAANAFLLWRKGRVNGKLVVLKGLERRRKAERKLFLEPDNG